MSLRDTINTAPTAEGATDPDDAILGIEPPASVAQPNNVPAIVEDEIEPDYGPAMAACAEKERRFVLFHFEPDISDAQAARLAGYGNEGSSANTMARIAFRLTHENPRVVAAIEEVSKLAVRALSKDAVKALSTIVRSPWHKDAAKVALSIMERVSPTVQRQDVNVTHEIVDHRQEALIQLKTLKALGVPREKLEELFGFTGLPMLERQLAQQEAAEQPAIEAEYAEIKSEE